MDDWSRTGSEQRSCRWRPRQATSLSERHRGSGRRFAGASKRVLLRSPPAGELHSSSHSTSLSPTTNRPRSCCHQRQGCRWRPAWRWETKRTRGGQSRRHPQGPDAARHRQFILSVLHQPEPSSLLWLIASSWRLTLVYPGTESCAWSWSVPLTPGLELSLQRPLAWWTAGGGRGRGRQKTPAWIISHSVVCRVIHPVSRRAGHLVWLLDRGVGRCWEPR